MKTNAQLQQDFENCEHCDMPVDPEDIENCTKCGLDLCFVCVDLVAHPCESECGDDDE